MNRGTHPSGQARGGLDWIVTYDVDTAKHRFLARRASRGLLRRHGARIKAGDAE